MYKPWLGTVQKKDWLEERQKMMCKTWRTQKRNESLHGGPLQYWSTAPNKANYRPLCRNQNWKGIIDVSSRCRKEFAIVRKASIEYKKIQSQKRKGRWTRWSCQSLRGGSEDRGKSQGTPAYYYEERGWSDAKLALKKQGAEVTEGIIEPNRQNLTVRPIEKPSLGNDTGKPRTKRISRLSKTP